MKLFIIVVVSVIVCCNAQDDSIRAVQLLEDILNETRAARDQSLQRSLAQENTLNELIDKVESAVAKLENISSEVRSTRQEAQDYHEVSQQWYTQPNMFVSFASCEDIKTMSPSAPSGYYNIIKYDGTTQRMYCDMEHSHQYLCGSTGWTRVAYLNMSDASQQCPTELRLYSEGGVRACGRRTSSSGSCNSVTFSTNSIMYSQICGRVIGYQYGHSDAIHSSVSIDSYYVEGISITHGSPRQHIWTLAAGYDETGTGTLYCPCNIGSTVSVPNFVGDDYFCESGTLTYNGVMLYTDDPLWDGEGCRSIEGPCCNVPGIPWFHKILNSPTTDTIELRVCASTSTNSEDVPVSLYELYVK